MLLNPCVLVLEPKGPTHIALQMSILPCISSWVAGPNFARTSSWRNSKVDNFLALHALHHIAELFQSCAFDNFEVSEYNRTMAPIDRVPAWTKLACKDLAGNFSLNIKFS